MSRGLWDRHTGAIIDVKLVNSDADAYIFDPMAEIQTWWEKIKKDKHGEHCRDQRKYFFPFVLSVNGMLGRESLVVVVNLSRLVAVKM